MADLQAILSGGIAGAILGPLITAGLEHCRRRRSRPDTAVMLFTDRLACRFSPHLRMPSFTGRSNATSILFEAENKSLWTQAIGCRPLIFIIEEGMDTPVLPAVGLWWNRSPGGKTLVEDATNLGPMRHEKFIGLVTQGEEVYYYDSMQVATNDAHAEHLWRRINVGPRGRFELLTYIEAENARRLQGNHYIVDSSTGNGSCVLEVKCCEPDVDFGATPVLNYLQSESSRA